MKKTILTSIPVLAMLAFLLYHAGCETTHTSDAFCPTLRFSSDSAYVQQMVDTVVSSQRLMGMTMKSTMVQRARLRIQLSYDKRTMWVRVHGTLLQMDVDVLDSPLGLNLMDDGFKQIMGKLLPLNEPFLMLEMKLADGKGSILNTKEVAARVSQTAICGLESAFDFPMSQDGQAQGSRRPLPFSQPSHSDLLKVRLPAPCMLPGDTVSKDSMALAWGADQGANVIIFKSVDRQGAWYEILSHDEGSQTEGNPAKNFMGMTQRSVTTGTELRDIYSGFPLQTHLVQEQSVSTGMAGNAMTLHLTHHIHITAWFEPVH